jgi:hypothetical protein
MTKVPAVIFRSKHDNVKYESYYDTKIKKYSGAITLKDDDSILLSSECVFKNKKEAFDKMKEIVKEIRNFKLS